MNIELLSDVVVPLFVGGVAGLLATRIEEQRLRKDFQLQDSAERAVRALLNDSHWSLRSFVVIRHHLGGFKDTELRQLLVRSGAVRFMSKSGLELWGLLERNKHLMGVTQINADPENADDIGVFGSEKGSD